MNYYLCVIVEQTKLCQVIDCKPDGEINGVY